MHLHFTDYITAHKRTIVAIEGLGGSGKSSLAEYLAGIYRATIIKIDDFTGWQPDPHWQDSFVTNILNPIFDREDSISYTPVSWWPDHKPRQVTHDYIGDLVIIEGTGSCSMAFRPYLTFGILVETDTDTCYERGVSRDIANGYDRDDVEKLWKMNLEKGNSYLAAESVADYASILLSGKKPFADQII